MAEPPFKNCPVFYRTGGWKWGHVFISRVSAARDLLLLARCWSLKSKDVELRKFWNTSKPSLPEVVILANKLRRDNKVPKNPPHPKELVNARPRVRAVAEVAYQIGMMRALRLSSTRRMKHLIRTCTQWEEVASLFHSACDMHYRALGPALESEEVTYYNLIRHGKRVHKRLGLLEIELVDEDCCGKRLVTVEGFKAKIIMIPAATAAAEAAGNSDDVILID
ncbi:protein ORF151 [Cyprinid herpesvirus 1]|uniref:Protein ORF151 n=1 Tax=Cyprinid herpesvirus 1 TaxID=317858 RepID=K7PCA4_9VIRU|nr:protein ORF151 [Cyprinid herpesvirus 1]AFJ20442.1 protein ORF151 [Cyprinid herpesvirus 1]